MFNIAAPCLADGADPEPVTVSGCSGMYYAAYKAAIIWTSAQNVTSPLPVPLKRMF